MAAYKLRGVGLLVTALAVLPAMDTIAKVLSGHLPVLEVAWARFLVYAALVLPVALWRHGIASLRLPDAPIQIARGALLAASAFMFFSAIAHMPLADAMAIFFVYPCFILAASAVILGERIRRSQWALVGSGFVGALCVIRPGQSGTLLASAMALGTGAVYAAALLLTRRLASHAPALVTSAISALTGLAVFSVLVPAVWRPPRPGDWALMALMGAFAALGHWLLVLAHRYASAAELAPYGYAELVAAVVFGRLVFGDLPTLTVWLGAGLIVASGILAARTASRSAAHAARGTR
jgi:drug/metabolite transporter (DMT)-like permease